MKHMAPYQIFFPFGVLAALLGVGFWLVPDQVIFGTPVQWVHSRLMVGGFLWGFITGFLMTAVPKMTGTAGATRTEMLTAAGLLSLSLLTSFFADGRWFQASQILVILFMMSFAFPRIGRRAKPAPVFFSHVALALILALSGRVFAFMGNSWMGFFLADVGVVLLLVLGIGMRFYSFLSGLPSEFEQAPVVHQRGFHFLGIALSLFLVLAGWLQAPWAYGGLFVITAAYLVFVWKVFRRSSRPSALKWSVRLVAFSIPLSFLFCAFFPGLYLAGLHVLFIGVFSLITFSVASRVVLAHGAYSLDREIRSRSLWIFLGLLIVALGLRLLYAVSEGAAREWSLWSASVFWLLALAVWGVAFGSKIFRKGELAKPSC